MALEGGGCGWMLLQQKLLKEIEEKDKIICELTEKVEENSAYRKQDK